MSRFAQIFSGILPGALAALLATPWISPPALAAAEDPAESQMAEKPSKEKSGDIVRLPPPRTSSERSLEETLERRRSVRRYASKALRLDELGQLLWAAQGITGPEGKRTAPSAGALYPLELTVVAGRVEGLEPGVYRYRPASHDLVRRATGDRRQALARAAGYQAWVHQAPAVLVVAGVVERTAVKYGGRARRYVHLEAGAAAENAHLQAVALGLGLVMVGAFDDRAVQEVAALSPEEEPFLLLPVGGP